MQARSNRSDVCTAQAHAHSHKYNLSTLDQIVSEYVYFVFKVESMH